MQSIIFDFNGTLFKDSDIHYVAWQRFMARRNRELTQDDFHRHMCGPPNEAILRHFLGSALTSAEIDAMSEEKESLYREIVLSDPACQQLTPGAPELFERLKRQGIPYAIATGSCRENVDFYFDALGIGRWFSYDNVFYAERGLPGKPDPTIYRLAMEKLGMTPGETLVVEDALLGIQSAIGAGVKRVVAIGSTLGAEAFAAFPQVIAVVDDFWDFERFLQP